MNTITLNKTIKDTDRAKTLVLEYIAANAKPGRRIFPGDYSGFPVSVTLKMLGFSTWGLKVRKLRCYDEDRESLMALIDSVAEENKPC